jgi:sugar phosphate isomerase/epimerase
MTLFTFRRAGRDAPIPGAALDLLARAAEACREKGVEMLLENSPTCWGNTGQHLAHIARSIGVRVTWDPANAAASGEQAYPTGYRAVRDRVAHVHLKNWDPAQGHVYLERGVVDLAGQLCALEADGYRGYYCIESHRPTDPAATETNTRQLLAMLDGLAGT